MKSLASLCAGTALLAVAVATAAQAQTGPEVYLGVLAHDVDDTFIGTPHEDGTVDLQLGARSQRYDYWRYFKINYYGKAEVNVEGLSSFYTLGIEARKHLFTPQFYLGAGIGLTYDAGKRAYKSPFDPGISEAEMIGRLNSERKWKAMGSDVLFNPNIFVGWELSRRWAVEGTWDHYSHAKLLGGRNPGMDNFGARVVYRFGAR